LSTVRFLSHVFCNLTLRNPYFKANQGKGGFMKKLITILSLLSISLTSFAEGQTEPYIDPTGGVGQAIVSASSEIEQVTVKITGNAAKALYFSLQVQPQIQTGTVQTQTKTVENMKCIEIIMGGDIGRHEANYTCRLMQNKK
jgi:hypothetical protein